MQVGWTVEPPFPKRRRRHGYAPLREGAQSVLEEDGTADGENFPADGANTEGLEG